MSEPNRAIPTVVDSEKQVVTFSNLCTVSISVEEAMLHFGLRNSHRPEIAEGVAKVYLTLPSLKRLRNAISQLIDRYEHDVCEIDADPSRKVSLGSPTSDSPGEEVQGG